MHSVRTFDFLAAETAVSPVAWLILLAGGIWLFLAADGYSAVADENERLARQMERLQRRAKIAATPVASDADRKSAPAQRRGVDGFPWDAVLREIELAIDPSVALISLDTDAGQRRSRIAAEARNIDDALAFASRLRMAPRASDVFLLSHEMKRDAAVPVIGFSLQVDWNEK